MNKLRRSLTSPEDPDPGNLPVDEPRSVSLTALDDAHDNIIGDIELLTDVDTI